MMQGLDNDSDMSETDSGHTHRKETFVESERGKHEESQVVSEPCDEGKDTTGAHETIEVPSNDHADNKSITSEEPENKIMKEKPLPLSSKANDLVNTQIISQSLDESQTSDDILSKLHEEPFNTSTEEDEDSSEADKDEHPPLLKYVRINKFARNFSGRDSISAVLQSGKLWLVGMHSGLLHIFDLNFDKIATVKCHRSSILCIDAIPTHFATGSIDGTIVIGVINDWNHLSILSFNRPIQAVALDRNFASTKGFVSGGMAGEVTLSQRNWLGNRTDHILSRDHGAIVGIYMLDDILVWMDESGITFCDVPSKSLLLIVEFPSGKSDLNRPDLYRPHLCQAESDRVLIGWGNNVWSFKVSAAANRKLNNQESSGIVPSLNPLGSIISTAASSLKNLAPDRSVTQEYHQQLNMIISGIASFKNDQLICLGFEIESKEPIMKGLLPDLKIIDIVTSDEVYNDQVVVRNYEALSVNDYFLGSVVNETLPEYFILSKNDLIKVQQLSLNDHYNWYIEQGLFKEAWEVGLYIAKPSERLKTGLKYINDLIEHENWDMVTSELPHIFGQYLDDENDAKLNDWIRTSWSSICLQTIDAGRQDLVAESVSKSYKIFDQQIPTTLLENFLKSNDLIRFRRYIRDWNIDDYDCSKIIFELKSSVHCDNSDTRYQREELIYLQLATNDFFGAVENMLFLRDNRALPIIRSHNLLFKFSSLLPQIMLLPFRGEISELTKKSIHEIEDIFQETISLLFENRHMIPVNEVIEHLSSPSELRSILFCWLKRVVSRDPLMVSSYENDMIELYVEFDKECLLDYLKQNTNYDIDRAINVCIAGNLTEPLIYLWGKLGESKKALSLIIDDLDDPSLAIDFVKTWGDPDLWDFMISYSLDKPKFIKSLLESSDEFNRSYLEVIKGISENLVIEGLDSSLNKILRENFLSYQTKYTSFQIVDEESEKIAREYLKLLQKGKIYTSPIESDSDTEFFH